MQAKLTGEAVPPPPARKDTARVRTYKTKNETDDKKGVTGPIVLTLLFIAVVVPMLQYWGALLINWLPLFKQRLSSRCCSSRWRRLCCSTGVSFRRQLLYVVFEFPVFPVLLSLQQALAIHLMRRWHSRPQWRCRYGLDYGLSVAVCWCMTAPV